MDRLTNLKTVWVQAWNNENVDRAGWHRSRDCERPAWARRMGFQELRALAMFPMRDKEYPGRHPLLRRAASIRRFLLNKRPSFPLHGRKDGRLIRIYCSYEPPLHMFTKPRTSTLPSLSRIGQPFASSTAWSRFSAFSIINPWIESFTSTKGPSVTDFDFPRTTLPEASSLSPWLWRWPFFSRVSFQSIHFFIVCCICSGESER